MIPQIKERIEKIRRGEVPDGYKKTKVGVVPVEWEVPKALKIFESISDKIHDGLLEVLSATQDRGVIPRSMVDIDIKYTLNSVTGYKRVRKGNYVISLRSFQGGIEYSEYDGWVSPAYTVLHEKLPINQYFYKTYFKTDDYIKRLGVATYGIRDGKQIGYEDFGMIQIPCPPLAEQGKIAEILSAQDKLIELKEKLIAEKQKQKKYLMQQLITGKKRIAGFNGKWAKKKIFEVADSCDNLRIPIAEELREDGNTPYYGANGIQGYIKGHTHCGEFVLVAEDGASDLCNYPVQYVSGTIWVNNHAHVLQAKDYIMDNKYLFYALSHADYRTILVGGTRAKLNAGALAKMDVYAPTITEQKEISKILSTADQEITLLQKELEAEKRKKKSLMQLLLTGIVRV